MIAPHFQGTIKTINNTQYAKHGHASSHHPAPDGNRMRIDNAAT